MSIATLSAALKLNIQDFQTKLKSAEKSTKKFARAIDGATVGQDTRLERMASTMRSFGVSVGSVARIVSGIMISQTFYGWVKSIGDAKDAVWEFTQELEYAHIAYTNMFGDQSLADEFVNVLEDFAAATPFDFTESEKAAKRLLAYGIQYKNVMYVMNGVLGAASVQGDPTKIESISRALGQIYTKGRLMNQEMNQLTEAGIPAWDILIEKLGLTKDQIGKIGNAGIDATRAINALVDGMTERYGSTLEAAALTTRGIISNIKDNATMIGASVVDPVVKIIKSGLYALGQFLYKIREIQETKGLGGVIEELFPKEALQTIRQFVANVLNAWQATLRLWAAIGKLLIPVINGLVLAYNILSPVFTFVKNVLGTIANAITSNAKAMSILTGIVAMAAVMWTALAVRGMAITAITAALTLVSKALLGLYTILTFVVAHPFWSLLVVTIAVVAALSGGFNKLGAAIRNMFSALTNLNGYDPDKLLLPDQKKRTNDVEKFNERLSDTADAMDTLADSTDKANKAGKAARANKGLLSFDEVFKLNDTGTSSNSVSDTLKDLEDTMAGLDSTGETFLPEVPDFTELIDNFMNGFTTSFADMWDALKEVLSEYVTVGLLGALGAVAGGILGGPIGAKIGLVAGALVGYLVKVLGDKFKLEKWETIPTALGIGLGAVFGALIGGPVGAVIGAGVGGLVSWITVQLANGFKTGNWDINKISAPLGAGIGMAIGAIAGGPVGAAIGAAIGTVVGFIVSKFAENFSDVKEGFLKPWRELGENMSGYFERVWNDLKEMFDSGNFLLIGTQIVMGVLQGILGAFLFIGGVVVSFFESIWNAICAAFGIKSPAEKMKPIGEYIVLGILEGFVNTLGNFLSAIAQLGLTVLANVVSWFGGIYTAVSTKATAAWQAAKTNFNNIKETITTNVTNAHTTVTSKFTDMAKKVTDKLESMKEAVSTKTSSMLSSFTSWVTSLKDKVFDKLGGWLDSAISKLKNFLNLSSSTSNIKLSSNGSGNYTGHATGGVFNREHVARFAEGNKAEAIIPLENDTAMRPFVNAVSNGLVENLAPLLAGSGGGSSLPPMYVGTLIADDRGLKQLYKKFEVIKEQEDTRKGFRN